eukprot:TRINITY_DN33294_c0_g1_i1.p1 TRINITY_DN33294_c0_g1~~TRINITY_DN33294_c0_g1_i1.p1  ORF type:complete len:468 (+),score=79.63 TRINITY_DN33294_c0_g1_i1:69-1406(+)
MAMAEGETKAPHSLDHALDPNARSPRLSGLLPSVLTAVVVTTVPLCAIAAPQRIYVIILAACSLLALRSRTSKRSDDPRDGRDDDEAVGRSLAEEERQLEVFMSKGYGRFKYCGLRDDPYADCEPPEYSTENLPIKLPELSAEELRKVEELESRVTDVKAGRRTDRATLLRYLIARRFNVDQAEALFRESVKWALRHDVDNALTTWNLEAYERSLAPWWLSGGILGRGLNNEVVALERIGHCHWPKLCDQVPLDLLLRIDMVHCQRVIAALEEDALRRSIPLGGAVVIMDLAGFGVDQAQFRAAYRLSKIIKNRTFLLTETTKIVLLTNAPAAFVKAWQLFSYLLDEGTKGKCKVVAPEETLDLLCKYIDPALLPAYLGGRRHEGDDPECRRLLAPGGPAPPAAIRRFLSLTSSEASPAASPASSASGFLLGDSEPKASRCCCGW